MEYREIEAPNIEEAKYRIKREYGDRARIIKIMETSKGGFFGFGSKKNVKVLISISDIDLLKKFRENMGIEKISDNQAQSLKNSNMQKLMDSKESLSISMVMEKLKYIEDQIHKNNSDNDDRLHPNLLEIKQILKNNEFYDEFIIKIIEEIKKNLTYSDIDNRIEIHKFVYNYIKEQLIISEDIKINNKKKILILVGPTGVGKTTTIAKIAANAIREKLKVELITIDGYRIGAKFQLEKYAEYMRAPVTGVEDNLELQKVVDLSEADLILVDTIGRSAKDEMNLVKMKQLLKFNRYKPEYALTISASTKVKEIEKIFKNFDLFDFNSIIITKLDECDIIGGILNSAIDSKKSLRYITDGQRVPNDIEKVSNINLMEKVKGLELEVYMNNV